MDGRLAEVCINLLLAWGAGALIGYERSYNGRAAGLRTHALVALAAASVASIAYWPLIAPGFPPNAKPIDPTRLAQGVMTGVGFLGAGVIFKEGVSVQGLTTAGSIWGAAAFGLLFGLGMYGPAALSMIAVLVSLTVFRWVERVAPERVWALSVFRFRTEAAPDEAGLRRLLGEHEVTFRDATYKLTDHGAVIEYRGRLETQRKHALAGLFERLRAVPGLIEFELDRVSK